MKKKGSEHLGKTNLWQEINKSKLLKINKTKIEKESEKIANALAKKLVVEAMKKYGCTEQEARKIIRKKFFEF